MCFVTYTFCFICKEETFNEPCICEPKMCSKFIFFQAEDGIRDAQESRGLGDVYKRQVLK